MTLSVFATAIAAQTIQPDADKLRANLAIASQIADIEGPGAVPFRLKATFSTFDYAGKPDGEGTLEETWLRPGESRRVIQYRGAAMTQVAADGGVHISDDSFPGSFMQRRIISGLLSAVPAVQSLPPASQMEYRAFKMPGGVLDCAETKLKKDATAAEVNVQVQRFAAYCMDPATHVVRVIQEGYDTMLLYNKLVKLGQHELAEDLQIAQHGVVRARLQVTSFQPAPDLKDTDFVPPANSVARSEDYIPLAQGAVAGKKIAGNPPHYPAQAKSARITGSVVLEALIDENGAVEDLEVISAPHPSLAQSAVEAVKTWRYTPYLVDGKPQKISTTITVNYALGL